MQRRIHTTIQIDAAEHDLSAHGNALDAISVRKVAMVWLYGSLWTMTQKTTGDGKKKRITSSINAHHRLPCTYL